jgi:hypothetical protein
MPAQSKASGAKPCGRCAQPTLTFWAKPGGEPEPWCNFCVAAQVMNYVGPGRCQALTAAFFRAIDSGAPEDLRAVSLALRGLATMLHDRPE